MASSEAHIVTEFANRYMGQLCQHFQHKLPVTLEGDHGSIAFPPGPCVLESHDNLLLIRVTVEDTEVLPQLQDVVARHLLRFAFRNPPEIIWQPAA